MAEIKEVDAMTLGEEMEQARVLLKRIAKAPPYELHKHRMHTAVLFNLAKAIWNDAWAPNLATRFDATDEEVALAQFQANGKANG